MAANKTKSQMFDESSTRGGEEMDPVEAIGERKAGYGPNESEIGLWVYDGGGSWSEYVFENDEDWEPAFEAFVSPSEKSGWKAEVGYTCTCMAAWGMEVEAFGFDSRDGFGSLQEAMRWCDSWAPIWKEG